MAVATSRQRAPGSASTPGRTVRRLPRIRISDVLSHGYIWLCLMVFVTPFVVLVGYTFSGTGGTSTVNNFQFVFGSFLENLKWSLLISGATLVGNVVIALPAAYALMRYPVPAKRLLYTIVTLPLYVPGAVIGLSLLLTYYFSYHLATSVFGLIFAMMICTFPLMLTPIVVALKDLPVVFEEASECLGATRWQTFHRIVLPLIGPGVSAGLMLTFIIVFNEYLVTLFVHPNDITTAPLRVFNVVKTAGLAPSTTALAVTMQVISLAAILLFFRIFGTRYFKGTYLI
jgi:putative spermidine/putrescine transport system permease protein